jgi:hypothetical protein
MSNIDPDLLAKLKHKLKLERSALYRTIERASHRYSLELRLAALAVALDNGISVSRFGSPEDWAEVRRARQGAPPVLVATPTAVAVRAPRTSPSRPRRRRGNTVYVVHGRNTRLRDELNSFLEAAGLQPLEWEQALRGTNKGSPYNGEVLGRIFRKAVAIVVLFTPDDVARLKPSFRRSNDGDNERKLTGQARPNVLFEAGMAYGRDDKSVVIVEIGQLRGLTNLDGRHVVRMDGSLARRRELIAKLKAAGCKFDAPTREDWLSVGNFRLRAGE